MLTAAIGVLVGALLYTNDTFIMKLNVGVFWGFFFKFTFVQFSFEQRV